MPAEAPAEGSRSGDRDLEHGEAKPTPTALVAIDSRRNPDLDGELDATPKSRRLCADATTAAPVPAEDLAPAAKGSVRDLERGVVKLVSSPRGVTAPSACSGERVGELLATPASL